MWRLGGRQEVRRRWGPPGGLTGCWRGWAWVRLAARRRRIAVAALAGILLALRKAGLARSSASSTGLRSLPLSPWAGLGVLTAWAAGALVAGGLVLRLRDG